MNATTDDLDHVYGAASPEESREIYDGWAVSYEADNLKKGFRLPSLAAGLFARYMGDRDGPVLDAGCGTGLVGETLNVLGYGPLTGCDLSPDMLRVAEGRGVYDSLIEAELGKPLPFKDEAFAGFACVGSFGPGHAPAHSLHELARVTRAGGIGVFNLIEATYEEQGFPQVMDDLTKAGTWELAGMSPPFQPYLLGEKDLWGRLYAKRVL